MIKIIKKIINGIISDIIDEIWTLVGLFAGWLVLTGSAKIIIGQVILLSAIVWLVRNRIKQFKNKED